MDSFPDGSSGADRSAGVRKRIFVVGCPRSGTTLLQAILASHPRITSFPETHFLPRVVPQAGWRRHLGLPSPGAGRELRRLAADSGAAETLLGPYPALLLRQVLARFVRILDQVALNRGAEYWLEKTPRHLAYTDLIERYVPEVRIVHIIRDPLPTVASLLHVTAQYPEEWDGRRAIEQCIERWIADVRLSMRLSFRQNHVILRYEDLVTNPTWVIRELCRKMDIPFVENMLRDFGTTARSLIRKDEPWKKELYSGKILNGLNRRRRLSPEEDDLVRRSTSPVKAALERTMTRNPHAILAPESRAP